MIPLTLVPQPIGDRLTKQRMLCWFSPCLCCACLQGNMDPGVLFGSKDTIAQRVVETVRSAQGTRHIMNLGHGVLVGTPEDNVAHFFEVGKTVNERL